MCLLLFIILSVSYVHICLLKIIINLYTLEQCTLTKLLLLWNETRPILIRGTKFLKDEERSVGIKIKVRIIYNCSSQQLWWVERY